MAPNDKLRDIHLRAIVEDEDDLTLFNQLLDCSHYAWATVVLDSWDTVTGVTLKTWVAFDENTTPALYETRVLDVVNTQVAMTWIFVGGLSGFNVTVSDFQGTSARLVIAFRDRGPLS